MKENKMKYLLPLLVACVLGCSSTKSPEPPRKTELVGTNWSYIYGEPWRLVQVDNDRFRLQTPNKASIAFVNPKQFDSPAPIMNYVKGCMVRAGLEDIRTEKVNLLVRGGIYEGEMLYAADSQCFAMAWVWCTYKSCYAFMCASNNISSKSDDLCRESLRNIDTE